MPVRLPPLALLHRPLVARRARGQGAIAQASRQPAAPAAQPELAAAATADVETRRLDPGIVGLLVKMYPFSNN